MLPLELTLERDAEKTRTLHRILLAFRSRDRELMPHNVDQPPGRRLASMWMIMHPENGDVIGHIFSRMERCRRLWGLGLTSFDLACEIRPPS